MERFAAEVVSDVSCGSTLSKSAFARLTRKLDARWPKKFAAKPRTAERIRLKGGFQRVQ